MAEKDQNHAHQDYQIDAEKVASEVWGHACLDQVTIKVHNQAEAKKIVDFLRSLGFAVALERRTKVVLEEDQFPSDEEQP